jgi:hypothetical protein
MMDSATYLVTREIAERSGLIDTRYRIADGRFVLNDRDLARVRFTPDEYISGLQGVEKVSTQEAELLIARNNYTMGLNDVVAPITETNEQPETPVEEQEQESENGDENEEVADEAEEINDETEQENNEQETNEEE